MATVGQIKNQLKSLKKRDDLIKLQAYIDSLLVELKEKDAQELQRAAETQKKKAELEELLEGYIVPSLPKGASVGGGGWVELKTINNCGPYAYYRWYQGKVCRSKYLGKIKRRDEIPEEESGEESSEGKDVNRESK